MNYELSFIFEPSITEADIPEYVGKLTELLDKSGAKVSYSETPRLRNLAYTIERAQGGKRFKFNQGYFGYLRFESEPASIEEIGKSVNALKFIIRSLLIHAPKKEVITPRVPRANKAKEEGVVAKVSEAEIEKEVDNLIASTVSA
jgi:ribosomal protein S6